MKRNRKLHMFLLFLGGVLASVMIAMMWLGGGVNFQEFLSGGNVYDVSPVSLKQSSKRWAYDEARQGYWMQKKKSGKYFELNGWDQPWNYLYLTVRESTMEPLEAYVRYYGPDREERYEQLVELYVGENIIPLDGEVPMVEMSLVFRGAKGQFVAISEIQLRTTPRFPISSFLKRFAVAFAGVMAVLFALLYLKRRFFRQKIGKHVLVLLLGCMQDVIKTCGNVLGSRIGGKLYASQQESVRRFLFSVLIVWMMVGNVLGWLEVPALYRYHVLVCALLLLAAAFVSWEKPLRNQPWHGVLMKSWLCLWLGIIVCEFFVYRQLEPVVGVSMLLAGTVFLYFWQNMDQPKQMFRDLKDALENTFFLGTVYCMLFRMKLPAVDYNGIFASSEESAMYGVLMAVVFLSDVEELLDGLVGCIATEDGFAGKSLFAAWLKNITGLAAALFFVLRSGHMPGILIFLLACLCFLPALAVRFLQVVRHYRALILQVAAAAILAYACVFVIFVSIKYVPGTLGVDVTYGNELRLTELQGTQKKLFLIENPGSLKGTRTEDAAKLPVIWRCYARRMNLFGHSGTEVIYYQVIKPYSGYLDMAYHHGIFILLPYVAFQITIISAGIYLAFRKKGRRSMFLLALGIAYVCFSFCTNVEIPWGHPLWLCFYLAVGCVGRRSTEENLGKEGLT